MSTAIVERKKKAGGVSSKGDWEKNPNRSNHNHL